eukprot:TRINITY_DN14819_c0_g1_i1.p1 TRINITY_DN14819_c0_g1~~TRINITY_DN14819_c0_g1_i1.p1  ORF type:complete len:444 (+),score=98.40 TRINITY_DN14819_c0_g1_i1:196-1332(+)
MAEHSVNVVFSDDYDSSSETWKIFECPKEVVAEIEKSASSRDDGSVADVRVTLRGPKSSSAVLCTDKETFDVRLVETSNQLYLAHALPEGDIEIRGSQTAMYEILLGAPRTRNLHRLLLECPFDEEDERGECNEDDMDADMRLSKKKYTWQDLTRLIQASDRQLLSSLTDLNAFEFNGHWRVFELAYVDRLLDMVINTAIEEGWNISSLSERDVVAALKGDYSPILISFGLKQFKVKCEGSKDLFRFDEKAVAVLKARLLLRNRSKVIYLDEFIEEWQRAVPAVFGITPEVGWLAGVAIVNEKAGRDQIKYFPFEETPDDARQRFRNLFETKPKWTMEELKVYLGDLVGPRLKLEQLVLKNARSSQNKNGQKVYGSRI